MKKEDRQLEAARTAAYRLLARRSRSVREIAARLGDKGFPEAVTSAVIERLRELNYLDDAAVARQWASSYARNNLWGDRKIEVRLCQMGIAEELIHEALAEVRHEFSQRSAIMEILEKRYPERLTVPAFSAKDEQRLIRHLAAKGFPLSMIFEVLANPVKEDDGVDRQ